jgi:short subunit dehydrogenase-like uncharacterized protein
MPNTEPPFDVVLFGATGFTGRFVAEYMVEHAEKAGVRWAIAGRNRKKLEAVRRELGRPDLPVRVTDTLDGAALDALLPETRVVATTVGPYGKYGRELVRACARHGVSYCDLAGEPPFVRAIIDECHETARGTRARIVPAAGFDSIPSDLGTYMAWDYARRRHGEGLAWVKVFAGPIRGKVAGGTVATALELVDAAKKSREVRRLLRDPHSLDPQPWHGPRDPFEDDQRGVRFDKDLGRWTAPFLMSVANARIVRRSHALLREESGKDGGYGRRFRYHEAFCLRRGPRGLVMASLVTAAIAAGLLAAGFRPTRAILERTVLPAPGEGPSRASLAKGFFAMHVLARTESGRRLRGRVRGRRDPGYAETATMISETAFCLAKDAGVLDPRYGVLTPASAMGMHLVERLRAAGMTFEMHDE